MAGTFVAWCLNPKPITDTTQGTEDRQWAKLHSSGIIMVSHDLQVPTDTSNQPDREGTLKGNWSVPKWGYAGASVPQYQDQAGVDLVVWDWTPDDPGMYVADTYGGLWPTGADTPVAAIGEGGAPFGAPSTATPSGAPIYKNFQMHSANSLPFGLGGFPSGHGWLLSYDGVFFPGWPVGPAPALQDPYLDILGTPGMTPINNTGVPGSNPTVSSSVIADFQVNPNNSGEYYVLFWSGLVFTGHAFGVAPTHQVTSAQPVGTAGNAYLLPHIDAGTGNPDPFVAMHVNWGDSIIAITARGGLWGYTLAGGSAYPPFPAPPPWQDLASGGWVDMAIIPYRSPSHMYLLGATGTELSTSISGTVSITGLTTSGTHATTTTPTLSWTYNAQYSVAQKSIQVRVYRQSYIDAQGGAFVPGQLAGTEDGWLNDRDSSVASDKINRNLRNSTAYRAYMRAQSAAGTWSAWVNLAFTMAIPVPAQPSSCTTTLHVGTYPGLGDIDITAGGSIGAGEYRQFQVSAAGGAFVDVWDAEATTNATVTDPFPPTNVPLTYRVRAAKRVPGVVASAWRTAAPVVLPSASGTPGGNRFIDYMAPGGPVIVEVLTEEFGFERTEARGEFQPMSAAAKTVTSLGVKGILGDLKIWSDDGATFLELWKLFSLTRSVVYQNVHGRFWWVRPTPGRWQGEMLAPLATETAGIRDSYDVTVRLVEVNPPRPT